MKYKKFNIQSCCGKTSIIYQIGKAISFELITFFETNGFKESKNFTKSGILYVQNSDLVITGAFGSDKLQVKCKKTNCDEILSNIENILTLA
jgi:hypothetical protein